MSGIFTYPALEVLEEIEQFTPAIMYPSGMPLAVIVQGYFTKGVCEEFAEKVSHDFDTYHHPGCNAATREIGMTSTHSDIPHLKMFQELTHTINHLYFNYDLDEDSYSWLQTYFKGGDYPLHMDFAPARSRKLTSVTLLSDPETYDGGDLELVTGPDATFIVPREQGTMVIFPSWVMHKVHEVTRGIRKSLNMGFHGPNFR